MRILLVDDEKRALHLLEEAAKEACPNDELFAFQDPIEALEFAKTTQLDVALLDINMGRMNGVVLAKNLKDIMPGIGVIFCTAYTEYAIEAIKLRANGYLMKPIDPEAIKEEIEALDHPRYVPYKKPLVIHTFGNFEVFYDGKPVEFSRNKSKEVLAYLVDCKGASASAAEIGAIIWEDGIFDRQRQKQLQKIISDLRKALKVIKADDIIIKNKSGYMIDKERIDCDYYRLLDGDAAIMNTYAGRYMCAYSWAEITTAYLDRISY